MTTSLSGTETFALGSGDDCAQGDRTATTLGVFPDANWVPLGQGWCFRNLMVLWPVPFDREGFYTPRPFDLSVALVGGDDPAFEFSVLEPVPEPATLLLIGTVLALLASRWHRWLGGAVPPARRWP